MLKKICFALFLNFVTFVQFSKLDQSVPAGFLGDCPGSSKPVIIKPKSLEKLTISVLGPGNVLQANYTSFNYYNIHKLVKHPDVDFKKKTFILFPGYLDTIVLPTGRAMASLYKELSYNALLVDYFYFTFNHFPRSVRMIRAVARHIAEMLVILTDLGLDPRKLETVGYSLGGQAMGLTAKHYRRLTGLNISSLTAIDPTGVCFRHLGAEERLDASDGDFVLQITTNMDGFGLAVPVGQVTIFVNGGEFQPGDIWMQPCLSICSHAKAYLLWLSALMNPGIFIAIQCDSVQQARNGDCYERRPMVTNTMDIFTDKTKPGIYYLHTFHRYPYGLGRRGLKKKNNEITRHLNWLNQEEVIVY